MHWLARNPELRADPTRLLSGARSVVSLLVPYFTSLPAPGAGWTGRVSRYAWGADYHHVVGRRLRRFIGALRELVPQAHSLAAVDSKPLLEKEWAESAGLGWIGKHTNLITTDAGSWFFLAEVVTDIALDPDEGPHRDRCGSCTACIDSCPTGAIVAPRVLDARRCISYLTIEHAGPIPRELRAELGSWIFGCDVCQDRCPWNRFARAVTEPRFRWNPALFPSEPAALLRLDEKSFAERLAGSALRRAGRDGLLRNVCISLGNERNGAAVPALVGALADASALVRAHAAWALGRCGGREARAALAQRSRHEDDPTVREEIDAALTPES
jgi:epoxyqueuosine reductase